MDTIDEKIMVSLGVHKVMGKYIKSKQTIERLSSKVILLERKIKEFEQHKKPI
jgi:hypothetical protein